MSDEDFPGTYDLCLGKDGWHLEDHFCTNSPCVCIGDPAEQRCGYTAEAAQTEIARLLRISGDEAEARRFETLSTDDLLRESFDIPTPTTAAHGAEA
jgi:hypothetical protein